MVMEDIFLRMMTRRTYREREREVIDIVVVTGDGTIFSCCLEMEISW